MSRERSYKNVTDSAAPLSSARQPPATQSSGKRSRRRGPRSKLALLRRSVPEQRRALPGMSPGESGDEMPVNQMYCTPQKVVNNDHIFDKTEVPASNSCHKGVAVYSVNIQCLLAHLAELEFSLSIHRPHIVLIQESWLDASTEQVKIIKLLVGYVEVSRRDGRGRRERRNCTSVKPRLAPEALV